MAMKVLSDAKPEEVFLEASDILRDAVIHTLGPKGLNTAVCTNSSGHYQILNDGKSIVQDLTSDSPTLAPALELLKQSCFETNRKAGDGTTSTILMTNKLLHNVYDYMNKNLVNPVVVRNQLNTIMEGLIEHIETFKQKLKEENYEDVAAVALGSREYAKLVSDAYKFVGPEGNVAFIKEDRRDVVLECEDGITLDKTEFKIIPMKEPREIFDCPIIVCYEKIDRFAEIIELLNKTTTFTGKKTILLYNEMSWDASSNIYANIGEGRIDIIPIRVGAYGTATRDVMYQIAAYCKCKMIDGQSVKLSMLHDCIDETFGKVNKSILSENKVVLCTKNKCVKSKDFLLQLENKSCIIKIGGSNKVEQEETFRRIEDAVSSLGTAIKDGIVQGGGLAYINAFESIRAIYDEAAYIRDVGEYIYRTVVFNTSGVKDIPEDYVGLLPGKDETADWIDLDSNIFDSAMVAKEVIRNSFSLVAQIITTNKIIHEMIR